MNKQDLGSKTAKGGFANEKAICEKLNQYEHDLDAQSWLGEMGYDLQKIIEVHAEQIPVRLSKKRAKQFGISEEMFTETQQFKKADILLTLKVQIYQGFDIKREYISLKKAKHSSGFNQIDKRPVSTYQLFWQFSDHLAQLLRLFTGDLNPQSYLSHEQFNALKDSRRLFLGDLTAEDLNSLLVFFKQNKRRIIADLIQGKGCFKATWFLVTRENKNGSIDWVLKDIHTVCDFFAQGPVKLSPRGSLKLGRITMQRKGGTPDPTSLQFKINPLQLFELSPHQTISYIDLFAGIGGFHQALKAH